MTTLLLFITNKFKYRRPSQLEFICRGFVIFSRKSLAIYSVCILMFSSSVLLRRTKLQSIQISSVTVSNLESDFSNLDFLAPYLRPIDCFIMTIKNLKCKYKHRANANEFYLWKLQQNIGYHPCKSNKRP